MTNPNKAELRRLAEATGGISWEASHAVSHSGERKSRAIYHYPTPFHCVEIVETSDTDPENGESIHDEAAWAFIGAANPANVLSLLDECDKLKADTSSMRGSLKSYAENMKKQVKLNTRLQRERDAALAELEAIKASGWRNHSVNYARAEKCPQTLETAQAAWDRDQELIEEQRQQIAKGSQTINDLRQKLEACRKDAKRLRREIKAFRNNSAISHAQMKWLDEILSKEAPNA